MTIRLHEGLYIVGGGGIGLSNFKDCNVYLMRSGEDAFLVDAGGGLDVPGLLDNIRSVCPLSSIRYLFLTHAHGDHAGGAKELLSHLPNAKLVASEGEKALCESGDEEKLGLIAAKRKGAYPADYVFHPVKVDIVARDEDVFTVGDLSVTSILVPGHSIESVCYLTSTPSGRRILFAGDSVYLGGALSLINCYGSSMEAYRQYFPRLADRGVDALLPAHYEFTLSNGQSHIDKALANLRSSSLPPMK